MSCQMPLDGLRISARDELDKYSDIEVGRRVESCKKDLLIHTAQLGLKGECAHFILRLNQDTCLIYARGRMFELNLEWFGHKPVIDR